MARHANVSSDDEDNDVLHLSSSECESSDIDIMSDSDESSMDTRSTKLVGNKPTDFYGDSEDDVSSDDQADSSGEDNQVEHSNSGTASLEDAFDLWSAVHELPLQSANVPKGLISFVADVSSSSSLALQSSPELRPLMDELKTSARSLNDRLLPLHTALHGTPDRTGHLMSFVELKIQLLVNYLMNLSFYILLKLKGIDVKQHPVVEQLAKVKLLIDKLRPVESRVKVQIDNLLTAAKDAPAAVSTQFMDFEMSEDHNAPQKVGGKLSSSTSELLKSLRDEFSSKPVVYRASSETGVSKALQAANNRLLAKEKYEEDNFIRLPTSKREKQIASKLASKRAFSLAGVESVDELARFGEEITDEKSQARQINAHLNSAKQVMTKDRQKSDSYVSDRTAKPVKRKETTISRESIPLPSLMQNISASSVARDDSRRQERFTMVAEKFKQRIDGEADGPRIAGFDITKNKGLIRKRKKEDRNARVKNRNKFESAQKRRRGQVQDGIRHGDDHGGHNYQGESSGLKSHVRKSTKLV